MKIKLAVFFMIAFSTPVFAFIPGDRAGNGRPEDAGTIMNVCTDQQDLVTFDLLKGSATTATGILTLFEGSFYLRCIKESGPRGMEWMCLGKNHDFKVTLIDTGVSKLYGHLKNENTGLSLELECRK